jgi:hypothetical protein
LSAPLAVALAGACWLTLTGVRTPAQNQTPAAAQIFVFDHPFWINLHHFLYVLGRAEAKTADSHRRAVSDAPRDQADGLSALSAGEQQAWRATVDFYARGPSRKDALFDGDMVAIGRQLVTAGDRPSLDSVGAVDPKLVDVLRRAAPLYRQAWWPRHDQANVALIQQLTELVGQHGETVRAFISRAYGERWPAGGFPVHVAAYANWAGAFSTAAGVLVVSSQDPATGGLHGLEIIVHEAMHQWDDAMYAALSREAQRLGTTVPDALSHAMIFFTAGQAVRHVSPTHVPYAESEGVWARGMGAFKPALESAWQPYLEGRGTRDEALGALLEAVK